MRGSAPHCFCEAVAHGDRTSGAGEKCGLGPGGTPTIALIAVVLLSAGAYLSPAIAADQPPPDAANAARPTAEVQWRATQEEAQRRARAEAADERRRLAAAQQALIEAQIRQLQMMNQQGRIVVAPGVAVPPYLTGNTDLEAGASLKTDAELDRLLNRADEFAAEGRYDLAVVLWQRVLDGSADTVTTREEWLQKTSKHEYRKYRSVSEEIERSLAKLPPSGLQVYRATADGEAKALTAAGEDLPTGQDHRGDSPRAAAGGIPMSRREQALAEVVRRLFLSSYGDDAAFELACLQMERDEFVGASRLLNKVLQGYPDSNVSRDQILLRLAVANARIGDRETAGEILDGLKASASANLEHLSLVRSYIEQSHIEQAPVEPPGGADLPGGWPMRFGGPSRTGHMKDLPPETADSSLAELWSKRRKIEAATASRGPATSSGRMPNAPFAVVQQGPIQINGGGIFHFDNGIIIRDGVRLAGGTVQTPMPATVSPGSMIERWKQAGWTLAGGLLLDRGRVFFKGHQRLICCDAATGETIWMGRRNHSGSTFPLQVPPTVFAIGGRIQYQLPEQPNSPLEMALFDDRVSQSMSIVGDLVLNVEGQLLELESTFSGNAAAPVRVQAGPGFSFPTESNWLSAYEVTSGKLKWYRGAADGRDGSDVGVSFLAAPIPYANLLLVPVADNGQLWVCGLAANDGKTVWKTFLCDEPSGGYPRRSPVGIAVDGGDAYLASGAGAIFALDALTGTVRWIATYPRTGQGSSSSIPPAFAAAMASGRQLGASPSPPGFREDVVIPHSRQLVVMCSDYDHLVAFDRRTGDLLWESPSSPASGDRPSTYCLGMVGDEVYVAGRNNVRQYHVPSGRLVWDTPTEDSFGQGALTEAAVYVPLKDSILRLDPKTGARQGQVPVVLLSDEPIGNLYSDGQRLLVLGMGHVYALGELKLHLEKLTRLVEQGSGQAQLARMRVRAQLGNTDDAVADLRGAYDLLLKDEGPASANKELYEAISDLELATAGPLVSLELLARSPPPSAPMLVEVGWKRAEVLQETLDSLYEKQLKGATALVLGVASLCTGDRLLTTARRAIAVTVDPKDEGLLRKSLASDDPHVRAVAAAGLGACLRQQPTSELRKMLTSGDEDVRLAAAETLADRGDRAVLPVLGALLASPELPVRSRSVQILRSLTGKNFHFYPHDPGVSRLTASSAWMKWIESEGKTARLNYPIEVADLILGRTLISDAAGRLVEIDSRGNQTWQHQKNGAIACHGLPNGHRLVASYRDSTIVEYDASGREVWRASAGGKPFSVRRLANGNTLVACYDNGKIQEIKPDGTVAWEATLRGNPMDARRLEGGKTLVCLMGENRLVEIDRAGRILWDSPGMSQPRSAQRLPNGNTLVSDTGNGRVIEIDRSRRIVWSQSGFSRPVDAQRLPDGNTLVADSRGVKEIDRSGNVVWQRNQSNVGRVCRF